MVTIHLSEGQTDNLLAFLARVDLKGSEALALAFLIQVISKAREGCQPPPEETPVTGGDEAG